MDNNRQRTDFKEFSVMSGIEKNWGAAFRAFCIKNGLMMPKPYAEWDELLKTFKALPAGQDTLPKPAEPVKEPEKPKKDKKTGENKEVQA